MKVSLEISPKVSTAKKVKGFWEGGVNFYLTVSPVSLPRFSITASSK